MVGTNTDKWGLEDSENAIPSQGEALRGARLGSLPQPLQALRGVRQGNPKAAWLLGSHQTHRSTVVVFRPFRGWEVLFFLFLW